MLFRSGLITPDLRPFVIVLAVTVAHSATGFAFGLRLPMPIAVPGALLGSFLWMVMLRGLDPRWLMLLNGETTELCCGRDTDLAPAAIWGPVIVAIGATLASGALIAVPRSGAKVTAGAIGVLALGLSVGAFLVMPLGADPNVPRDAGALVCMTTLDGVRACVWPEHEPRLDEVAAIASEALRAWRSAGLDVPSLITEGQNPADRSLRIGFALESTSVDILDGLAYAMVPPWPACADRRRYPGGLARPYLEAWLAAVAGMGERELASRWGGEPGSAGVPSVLGLLGLVRARPMASQLAWEIGRAHV